jgi:hypothetical protein
MKKTITIITTLILISLFGCKKQECPKPIYKKVFAVYTGQQLIVDGVTQKRGYYLELLPSGEHTFTAISQQQVGLTIFVEDSLVYDSNYVWQLTAKIKI